ncbi:protein SpAN-like [Haliotis cracherodii]|uniref:protein SpAN-like n=1 Tax=Haliotis cracherodii TaxID=6455 RepID=UPI0039E92AE6
MDESSLCLKLHLLQVLTVIILPNCYQSLDLARHFGRFIDVEDGKTYQSFLYDLLSQEPEDENLLHPVRNAIDGDLLLTPEQKEQFLQDNKAKRKIIRNEYYLWPKGIVLWRFAAGRRAFKRQKSYTAVLKAIHYWEQNTCLRFLKHGTKEYRSSNYNHRAIVSFGTGRGCASRVGYSRGFLKVYLNERYCMRRGTIVHEIGHAIGFFHEQARADRRDHVTVNKQNVRGGRMINFVIIRGLANRASYDLGSIMHYGPKFFSKNGRRTISPKLHLLTFLMGQRRKLSFYDLQEVNQAYKCAASCTNAPSCENGGFLLKSCRCHCPDGLAGSRCQNINSRYSEEKSGVFQVSFGESIDIKSPRQHEHTTAVWLIKSPEGTTMKMHLILDLSYDRVLRYCHHWVEVRFNLVGQPGPRFCGRSMKPLELNSTTNLVMVKFESRNKYYHAKRGFLLHIAVVQPINTHVICTFKDTDAARCPFQQSKEDDIDWKTFVINKISLDNDEDRVSYIAIDSRNAPQAGKAILRSAEILEGSWCLKFLYFVNAAQSRGYMHVLAMTTKRTGRWYLWGTPGSGKGEWSPVELSINSTDRFMIQFVGVVKDQLTVGVSMIELIPEPCQHPNKSLILLHKKDLKVSFTCDFDVDWCGFTDENHVTPRWSRRQSFPVAGPSHDHKQQDRRSGFYMSRKSPSQTGKAGRLVSPTLTAVNHYGCVRFWIYVWGFSPGIMSVYLRDGRGSQTTVWRTVYLNPTFKDWSQITVPIKPTSNKYKIIFETAVAHRWANIALDDVTVSDSHC